MREFTTHILRRDGLIEPIAQSEVVTRHNVRPRDASKGRRRRAPSHSVEVRSL
jgi:hypothetical protein